MTKIVDYPTEVRFSLTGNGKESVLTREQKGFAQNNDLIHDYAMQINHELMIYGVSKSFVETMFRSSIESNLCVCVCVDDTHRIAFQCQRLAWAKDEKKKRNVKNHQ